MTTTERLQAARDKISDPRNWCQDDNAVDGKGVHCWWGSPDAVSWCAEGALGVILEEPDASRKEAYEFLQKASESMWGPPFKVNDTGEHDDVMEMYDLAIHMSQESA